MTQISYYNLNSYECLVFFSRKRLEIGKEWKYLTTSQIVFVRLLGQNLVRINFVVKLIQTYLHQIVNKLFRFFFFLFFESLILVQNLWKFILVQNWWKICNSLWWHRRPLIRARFLSSGDLVMLLSIVSRVFISWQAGDDEGNRKLIPLKKGN